MTEAGLASIENPSAYFVTKRERGDSVSGSAIAVLKEGSRPVIAEIESLVSPSFTPYPSRISETMKKDTMNTLISILEQRGGIKLYDKNVVIKTTGGLYLKEQAANLAVLMSIASSVYDKPIPSDWAFLADVGLTGELKRVPSMESRIKELDRMGFKQVFIPAGGMRELHFGEYPCGGSKIFVTTSESCLWEKRKWIKNTVFCPQYKDISIYYRYSTQFMVYE